MGYGDLCQEGSYLMARKPDHKATVGGIEIGDTRISFSMVPCGPTTVIA